MAYAVSSGSEEDDDLINAIDAAESNSYGSGDNLPDERALAIRYYLGDNVHPAPDGRSQVVDRSLYETVQWMLPSLSRIFASGDDVVELPPVGPEDEAGAKQEGQYLNYIVLQRNNWFDIFNTAAKDALITKAGYLYPYREQRRQVELETYERQTQEGVALIMQDKPDIVKMREYPDPDYVPPPPQPMVQQTPMGPQPVIDPQTGQPAMQPPPPPTMLYDITIRRTKEETAFCIVALPPERCRISKTTTTVQLRESSYFEYYDYPTLSELRQDGYEIEDDVEGDEPDAQATEEAARDLYGENAWQNDQRSDAASRRVKCRWIWIRHDYDQDGIAELQYVVRVGKRVLHREEVNRIPIAVLCADPLPHRHVGQGIADTTVDLQVIKTAILRQGLDNLYLSNNPQKYGDPAQVNLDDMLVSRPGGIWRKKGGAIFGQDFGVVEIPFVFDKAMAGLEYMDQVRENRTGTNRYFTGIDQNALNKTATGIQQLSTMAAQRVEQIARHFSNGVTELFSILHEVILKSGHKAETIKLSGKWVDIDPSTWRSRSDFKISVGYAAGNKDALVARLQLISNQQMQAIQLGLPIVQPRNVYETNVELAKAADMSTPERFFTDPSTVPPPGPPQPDPTIVAAEQIKAQSAERIKQADVASSEKIKEGELQVQKYVADLDADTKLRVAHSNQMDRMADRQHAKDMEVHKGRVQADLKVIDGQHSAQLESHRASLNPKMVEAQASARTADSTSQMLHALAKSHEKLAEGQSNLLKALTAPKRIVRDKQGKMVGAETVTQ